MARRYINTSKFNPYTYQELAAPLERATALLSQQAQNLSNVEMQNLALGKYLDPETDAEEIQIYENNMKNLRGASDHLMKYGLRGDIYNIMKNANIAYFTDIQPIQNAISNRLQFYSKRNEFLSANPDVVIKGPLKHSLKEFYNGIPQLDIISGKAIQNDVAAVMEAIANGISSVDKKSYDKYNDIVTQITGFGIEGYRQMSQDPNSLMQQVMHDIMRKYGAEDNNKQPLVSNEDYLKLWEYAKTGSYAGIGKTSSSLKDSHYFQEQANSRAWSEHNMNVRSKELELILTAQQIAAQTGADPKDVYEALKNPNINTLNLFGGSSNNVYVPHNDFSKDPQPNDLTTKVSDGGESFHLKHIINLSNDVDNYLPEVKDGVYDWNAITKWRPFNGKSGDAIGKGVAEHVFALCGISDYRHMTEVEYKRAYSKFKELGYKAEHVFPVYRTTFTGTAAKDLMWKMRSHFIEKGKPDDEAINNMKSVEMVLDTKNPNIIQYRNGNNTWSTTATEMVNIFSNEYELKQSYERLASLTKNKSNSYQILFWNAPIEMFDQTTGKIEESSLAAFDKTIDYVKNKLSSKKEE